LFGLIDNADACPLNDPDGSNIRPNTRFFTCAGVFSPVSISWVPTNTLTNPTTANPIAVPTGTTTYAVQYTFANGCVRSDSVTVSPTSFEAIASNDTAICLGSSAVLSVIGGDEYLWAPANGLSSTTGASVTASPTETTTYIVTTTDNTTGCTDRDTIIVTVNPLPVISFSGNNQQCFQNEFTIDAGSGFVSYLWEPTQETTQAITVDAAGTYVVTVVDVNGCENTDEIVLSIGTPPITNLGNDLAGCDGDEFILDAGIGFDSYQWSTSETTSSITVTLTGSYIVTVTDADGCSARDTVNVTIVSPNLSLGNDTTICDGAVLRLVAGSSGPNYLWSTTETTPSILVSNSGTYSVTVTVSGATTCTATDEIVVTVNDPIVVDLGPNNITCNGNPLVLDADAGFASYQWSPNGETTQTISVLTSGIYGVTVTDAFGCTGSDALSVIDINPVVNAGNDRGICQGETATLTATANNANVTYLWTAGNQTTSTISVNTAGSYIVTATDANGCFGIDTVVVTVFATPVPDLGADVNICGNETATL
jgi:hypothetical protein